MNCPDDLVNCLVTKIFHNLFKRYGKNEFKRKSVEGYPFLVSGGALRKAPVRTLLIYSLRNPRKKPMKQNKYLHIKFSTLDTLGAEIKKAMKSKAPMKNRGKEIRFETHASFMNFLFPHKFSLLIAIKIEKPKSLYQLAKIVGRQQNAVLRDCDELEAFGFIVYEPGESRNSKVPKLKFDYEGILVHDPRGKSAHLLPSASVA